MTAVSVAPGVTLLGHLEMMENHQTTHTNIWEIKVWSVLFNACVG